ncbi:MAG: transposase, partial [Armatimonadota bacterium]
HLFIRDEMKTRMCLSLIRDCVKEQARLYSFVVMSNHLHMIIKPNDHQTISTLVKAVKVNSVTRLRKNWLPSEVSQAGMQESLNRHQYWQASFRGNPMYTKVVADQKTSYIHANPIRAGLVTLPEDYVWSSLNLINLGMMSEDETLDLRLARDYYDHVLNDYLS